MLQSPPIYFHVTSFFISPMICHQISISKAHGLVRLGNSKLIFRSRVVSLSFLHTKIYIYIYIFFFFFELINNTISELFFALLIFEIINYFHMQNNNKKASYISFLSYILLKENKNK